MLPELAALCALITVSVDRQSELRTIPPLIADPIQGPSEASHPWSETLPETSTSTTSGPDALAEPGLPSTAQDTAAANEKESLAMKLANPVAALISVPFQSNWDTGIGPADADRTTINIQPVIPISLNDDWNVISRTILPVIDAESPVPGGSDESGIGDVLASAFFSPKLPTDSGWIWGVGPVALLPTASDDALGSDKWAAGPTAVALKQVNGWTMGALANHLWSFAGEDNGKDINATFLQPFLSYTTKTQTTIGLNTESTYNWDSEKWTVPINVTATQLLKIGKLPISVGLGYRNYVEAPSGGPDWGLRLNLTLLFPK